MNLWILYTEYAEADSDHRTVLGVFSTPEKAMQSVPGNWHRCGRGWYIMKRSSVGLMAYTLDPVQLDNLIVE